MRKITKQVLLCKPCLEYKFCKSITRAPSFNNSLEGSRLRGLKDYKTFASRRS
jgi:hypothetical protein